MDGVIKAPVSFISIIGCSLVFFFLIETSNDVSVTFSSLRFPAVEVFNTFYVAKS